MTVDAASDDLVEGAVGGDPAADEEDGDQQHFRLG